MYQLLRNILFCFPPEDVHYFAMGCLKMGTRLSLTDTLIRNAFQFRSNQLEKELWGLRFPNPVGLGAGFDKNACYLNELDALGFGFVEIGTVTPRSQPGNDKPRLFRLPHDKALINRMGFNNEGVAAVKQRLINWNNTGNSRMIIGGNIGKNKVTPNEDAWKDYKICFNELYNEADYFVVNVSSPNTPGLRELQEKDALRRIFGELQNDNAGKPKPKPLLLKIAPDLTQEQLDDIISLAFEINLSGLVATNTTIDRSMLSPAGAQKSEAIGMGGLSGKPVQQRSTEVLSYLSRNTERKIPIIASGGVFTGEDAVDKFNNGASLVQVWTGFVYEGPAIAKKICTYLAR
ncbi:MAG TPA: quinone-dependent dihydroorotate dehydrogenase [Sediminibacterium sp.]|nr:quinone-dependent dihydroorotate dehydrogenase [Sediminibacterium sp.]